MKRVTFLAALLLSALTLFAQEYKVEGQEVVFTKVIENTGKTVQEAHDALEAYFAKVYNDVNSTQKLNQPDHLIYKGLFGDVYSYTMGMWVNDVPHTVDVAIKDNRLRIKVTLHEGICRSTQNLNRYTYIIAEAAPLGSNNKNILKKVSTETFERACARVNALLADIENSLNKTIVEEDW